MLLLDDWLARLPKAELHLHLEGAIPLPALWCLIEKYGGDPEARDLPALTRRFQYRDFQNFLEIWFWKNGFLREYEDFTLIAAAVAEELASQNIRYVEAFFSPGDFAVHDLEPQRLTAAIRAGLDQQRDRVEVLLIADLVRDCGPEFGMRLLHQLVEVRNLGVIGIGIGGSEHRYPPEPYAPVYRQARRLGFRTTAHAGEAAGPESVWGAIRALEVDRVGHGTRAVEDPELVELLRQRRTPIEMCPLSNVRTGVVPRIEDHPVARLLRAGLLVSVHTDDPKMFGNSLQAEYAALIEHCGLTRDDILLLAENAIASAWCDDRRKAELARELQKSATTGPKVAGQS